MCEGFVHAAANTTQISGVNAAICYYEIDGDFRVEYNSRKKGESEIGNLFSSIVKI